MARNFNWTSWRGGYDDDDDDDGSAVLMAMCAPILEAPHHFSEKILPSFGILIVPSSWSFDWPWQTAEKCTLASAKSLICPIFPVRLIESSRSVIWQTTSLPGNQLERLLLLPLTKYVIKNWERMLIYAWQLSKSTTTTCPQKELIYTELLRNSVKRGTNKTNKWSCCRLPQVSSRKKFY